MVLTSLINFARSKQTNGRYVLAPFAWVFALMFSLGRQDGIPPVPPIVAAVVAPETVADDTVVIPSEDPEIVSPPARVIEPPAPRPIRRDSFFSDLRGPLNLNDWRMSQLENTHAGVFYGGPWVPENIIQKHDRLILKVRAGEDGKRPTMAEMQSRRRFGHGRYEVIMRPSGESGVVSTFFTYTGPFRGDPHDEVDIEFIGARPEGIEYNYFRRGRKGAYSREQLDFDISERMNLYAFEWHPDEIIWFVNGEEHYRSPRGQSRIPETAGNIYISAWTGISAMNAWTGPPRFGDEAQAEYACVSFKPFDSDSYSCADLWADDPQFQYDDLEKSSD